MIFFTPHLFPDPQDKAVAFRDCVSLYYPIVHMESSRMPKYLDLEVWLCGCVAVCVCVCARARTCVCLSVCLCVCLA